MKHLYFNCPKCGKRRSPIITVEIYERLVNPKTKIPDCPDCGSIQTIELSEEPFMAPIMSDVDWLLEWSCCE